MALSPSRKVEAHVDEWATSIASTYGVHAFPATAAGGGGIYEAEVKLMAPDSTARDDGHALASRIVREIPTVNPTEPRDGLRIIKVSASVRDVGGRPGVLVALDVQPL